MKLLRRISFDSQLAENSAQDHLAPVLLGCSEGQLNAGKYMMERNHEMRQRRGQGFGVRCALPEHVPVRCALPEHGPVGAWSLLPGPTCSSLPLPNSAVRLGVHEWIHSLMESRPPDPVTSQCLETKLSAHELWETVCVQTIMFASGLRTVTSLMAWNWSLGHTFQIPKIFQLP